MSDEFKAVDECGNPIKISIYMQNKMYRESKELKEKIRGRQLTRSQCWKPNKENVDLMQRKEFTADNMKRRFDSLMGNLGAGPDDRDVERLRRR